MMAGTKKPRRKYRPKPVDTFAMVSKLVNRAQEVDMIREADPDNPASKQDRDRLMTVLRSALESIGRGNHPGEDDWRFLSDAVNLVETMILRGNLSAEECGGTLDRAVQAMVDAATRFRAGKGMRMDGPGLAVMREILDLYEYSLEGLTERETTEVMVETQRRVRAIQHGAKVSDRSVILL